MKHAVSLQARVVRFQTVKLCVCQLCVVERKVQDAPNTLHTITEQAQGHQTSCKVGIRSLFGPFHDDCSKLFACAGHSCTFKNYSLRFSCLGSNRDLIHCSLRFLCQCYEDFLPPQIRCVTTSVTQFLAVLSLKCRVAQTKRCSLRNNLTTKTKTGPKNVKSSNPDWLVLWRSSASDL